MGAPTRSRHRSCQPAVVVPAHASFHSAAKPIANITIGIGSNIDAENNIREAAHMLRKVWSDARFSSVYQTVARDYEDQPDFLNAAATFQTDLKPREVLQRLQEIETLLGKAPPFKFGPRTIDLDLLLYDNLIVDEPGLHLPHPRMHQRRFVLEPLCDLLNEQSCCKVDISL